MSLLKRSPKRSEKAFLEEVEKHQQAWGNDTYKGKPTLEQMLSARIVAFWYPSGSEDIEIVATLHKDLDEITEYVTHLVWHTKVKLPAMRLSRVFVNRQEVRIKAVKVIFERIESK